MKRISIALASGALSMFLLAPCVKAQSWQDTQNDQNAIEEGHEQIHHDRQELRNDLRNGDYGAAANEKHEMEQREEANRERQEDLNNDMANQNYNGDENYNGNEEEEEAEHQPMQHHHHHEHHEDHDND